MKRILLIFALILALCLSACGGGTSNSGKSAAEAAKKVEILNHEEFLYEGDTAVFTAAGDGEIVWASSDTAVATVEADGTVKGVSSGSATITASLAGDESVSAQTELRVGVHVSSVSLEESELRLLAGTAKSDAALKAAVLPENAANTKVLFQSSDTGVVTVDENGALHAVAPGTATITARAEDEACTETAECAVTVAQGVASIELAGTKSDLYKGDKVTVKTTILPENAADKAVEWTSSDENVAKVAADGTVTAVGGGEATIVCTARDGGEASAEFKVSVVVGVKSFTLSEKEGTVLIGAAEDRTRVKVPFKLSPEDTTFKEITWTSSDESIATVDENGYVTGVSAGKATITGKSSDPKLGDKGTVSFKVTVGQAVTGIQINGAKTRLKKGGTAQLKASVTPENAMNKKYSWSSSNKKVVTVSAKGELKAVGVGKATITAKAKDGSGVTASFEIEVYQAVTGVKAKETGTIRVFAGKTKTLHVIVSPKDATNKKMTWSSSDTSIATVDESGVVTAKKAGKVTITAKAKDGSGKKVKFTLNVEPKVPITIKSAGFGIYNGNLLALTVRNKCSNTTIKNFDFTITLYDYAGRKLVTSGSYNLGKNVQIGPKQSKTIKRTMAGISQTYRMTITITAIKMSNGKKYEIPYFDQETWTFTRY